MLGNRLHIYILGIFLGFQTPSFTQTLKIMPLGDSITKGIGGSAPLHGYRDSLYNDLVTDGVNFDFVGTYKDGDGSFDVDHEGISGIKVFELADSINAFLQSTNPDLVLLHIGTNDISAGEQPLSIKQGIATLVDEIYLFNKNIKIILAAIIPRADASAKDSSTTELNSHIRDLINQKKAAGYKIYFVDQNASFKSDANWVTDYMSADGLHPNDVGYQVMSNTFFNAVKSVLNSPNPGVVDDFNRPGPGLGGNWAAHSAYAIVNNQLSNTSNNYVWGQMATWIANSNPKVISFRWGAGADALGIDEGGLALRLDAPTATANGYLVWLGTSSGGGKRIRLWTIVNGQPQTGIQDIPYSGPEPAAGDTFKVVIGSDASGHYFDCYLNDALVGRVVDPNKLQGNVAPMYAGVMLRGNLNNDVDDFDIITTQDILPPGDITDLTVLSTSGTSANLQWTAPGDDGNSGVAVQYDIRYSTSLITAANFASADPAAGVPPPSSAGTVETFALTGLSPNTKYYFAIQTKDDAGNTSNISNVVSARTKSITATWDDFNRSSLGANWTADPAFSIINGELNNTSGAESWDFLAIYSAKKNPGSVQFQWGSNADNAGITEGGFALMLDAASTTASGYLLFRQPVKGKIQFYTIVNGTPGSLIQSVSGQAPAPQAGDTMKVDIRTDASGHHFDLYINGKYDGTVSDPNKLQGNGASLYAGVMLHGNRNNAIDNFALTTQLGAASVLAKESGDLQQGKINHILPQPLVVKVLDSNGNGIPEETVKYEVTQGDGTILPNGTDFNLRVEIGGNSSYVDASGNTWEPDKAYAAGSYGYVDGNVDDVQKPIANTQDDRIYQTERWGLTSYKVDVPNGDYTVVLHFVENVYTQANKRLFNVSIEGIEVLSNFDIFSEAGGKLVALSKTFQAVVSDGTLNIGFEQFPGKDTSSLVGLEVFSATKIAVTDANGLASRLLKMGTTMGTHKVTVTPVSFSAPAVVFTETATAGDAVKIVKISGDNQSGPAGQELAQPLVVELRDAGNNPVANYDVNFVVTQGSGLLNTAQPMKTDANGQASVMYTVGNQHATNKILAYAPGLTGSPVTFTATATGGVAATIQNVSGDNQTAQVGATLPNPITIKVIDANNQPVPTFPVDFVSTKGGGQASKENLLKNPGLEGQFYTHDQGRGQVASQWDAWNNDNSETHSQTTGFNSASAQRMSTMGSANTASISQQISLARSPANGTKMLLSFYYKTSGSTNPALQVLLRKTVDSIFVNLNLPPTSDQWVHFTHYFTWNSIYQPLQIHLIAKDSSIVDLDNIKIFYLTDSQGKISTTWTLGDTSGVQKLQAIARAEGTQLTNSPLTFQATANAGSPQKLVEIGGNNQIGSAGQPLAAPLKVEVQDAKGNPIIGYPVTFNVTKGGGKLNGNLTSFATTTNENGMASTILTLGPNTGVTNEVQAAAFQGNSPLAGSPIKFTAIAVVPAKMVKLSGDNQAGSASLPLNAPLKVQITDAQDRPISGFEVTFQVTQGGGTINGKTTTVIKTLGNGEAIAPLVLGPNPGTVNKVSVSATYQGSHLTGSPLTFTANASELAQLVLLDGNDQTGIAGSTLGSPLKAKVIDSLSNGIKGWPVTFKVTQGGGKLDGTDTVKIVNTDSLGIAKVNLKLGPVLGMNTNQVTASTNYKGNPLSGSPITFMASGIVGPPVAIVKAGGDKQRGVVGSPLPEPLKVKVVDKAGNGIANHDVTFEVKAGGGKINGQNLVTLKTNSSGFAEVNLTLGLIAGEDNNKVEVRSFSGSSPLGNSPLLFTASGTNTPARYIQYVSGSGQQGRAGSDLEKPLVVKVTDSSPTRNPVPNHPVTFKVIKGGGTLKGTSKSEVVVATDNNGLASVTWSVGGLLLPDSQRVEASSTDGKVALNGSPIAFKAAATPGPTSPTRSVIEATGPVPADGQSLSQVTIYLKDAFGNPIVSHAVIIKVSGSGNNINQPLTLTDSSGKVSGSFSSTQAGIKIVTAFDLNTQTEITNAANVKFESLDAAKIVMAGGNNQSRNVGTALAEPFLAKVTDKNGNPVGNYPVQFEVEKGDGYILELQPVRTDTNGIARATYVLGQNPGQNIINARAVNLNVSPVTFNATGQTNAASQMSMVSGNEQAGIAGENLPAPLVVMIADQNGDPIFDFPVNFRVTFGGGSIQGSTENTAKTNAFGRAKVVWKLGQEFGPNVLWAEAVGLAGSPQIFTAQGTSGSPDSLKMVSGNGQSGTVGQQAPGGLVVEVIDRHGNPVSNVIVKYQLVYGSGSLSATQKTTGQNGRASVSFTFGTNTGARMVRAYSDGLFGSPVNFHLTGIAGAPRVMTVLDGNNQSGTINKPLSRPIRVFVEDQYQNPVPNAKVNFVITAGGGSFSETQPVATDGRGIGKTTWILGPNTGENRVWAVMQGVTNSPLEFTAHGAQNNFPVFTPVAEKVIKELDHIEFEVKASDADGDPITYGARQLPAGSSFDSLGTHIFSWTTGYSDAGTHEIIFTAKDSKGGLSEMLVTIHVNNVNRPPILANWQPTEKIVDIPGGQTQTFQVTAIDPDGDKPGYLWFIDGKHVGSNNTYLFQPFAEGSFHLKVLAFDAVDTVQNEWTVITAVNLVSFSAAARTGEGIYLRWITANESNNAGFNVLRSANRAGNYQILNQQIIKPNGTGDYEFIDKKVKSGKRYYYMLETVSANGNIDRHGPIMIEMTLPESFALYQNFPNPFNPSTNIRFELPRASQVTLRIFNALGQEVRKLVDKPLQAGSHTIYWDGKDKNGLPVPSGIYYYRFRAGKFTRSRKMLLLK